MDHRVAAIPLLALVACNTGGSDTAARTDSSQIECRSVIDRAESPSVADNYLEAEYSRPAPGECRVHNPPDLVDVQFECGIIMVMLAEPDSQLAASLAETLGGQVRRFSGTVCGNASIRVPEGSERESLEEAFGLEYVLSVSLNTRSTVEIW